jgi:hypothetical protein
MTDRKVKLTKSFSDKFLDDFIKTWNGRFKNGGETAWCSVERRELTNGEVVLRKLAAENPGQFAALAGRVFAASTPREEVREVGENLAGILEGMNRKEVDMGRVINGQSKTIEQRRIKDH